MEFKEELWVILVYMKAVVSAGKFAGALRERSYTPCIVIVGNVVNTLGLRLEPEWDLDPVT